MKSLPAKRGIILGIIGLFILGYVEVWGADWEYYGHTSDKVFFYDPESISYPTQDLVRVWVKSVRGGEDFEKKMELFTKLQHDAKRILDEMKQGHTINEIEMKKTSDRLNTLFEEIDAITKGAHDKDLLEIKCKQKMWRLIHKISYDKNLMVIRTWLDDNAEWSHIVPESVIDGLFKEVCRSAK